MSTPPPRPDLTGIAATVVAYVEWLEAQLAQPAAGRPRAAAEETAEPPTTINILTISRAGMAKRTPRHLYGRQRRGGMGVFDLELGEDDAPAALVAADEAGTVLVFTNGGRTYRLPVALLPESPVRARGHSLRDLIQLSPHEQVVAALPAAPPGARAESVVLLSQRGWVRRVRASFLGPSLIQGTIYHDVKEGGPLVAAAWTSGRDDLFIATREGKAIRFAESQVPARGCLGIRLDATDAAVAVAGVDGAGGVFLMSQDGLGTVRLMSGFAANKAPGAGGKVAMKTDALAGAVAVGSDDDVVAISRLGKIIRFAAAEIPPKEGVVQGVSGMALRADDVAAMAALDL
jgi:DNA gyrase subunit A